MKKLLKYILASMMFFGVFSVPTSRVYANSNSGISAEAYEEYKNLDLSAYTNDKLPVYNNSRVTSIKRDGASKYITFEGYSFIKDRNFDTPNALWRELILVNLEDLSTDSAYRFQVTSTNKGGFLNKNQILNPTGKFDYTYASYSVTIDVTNIKKYDNKTYEHMKPGYYLPYMRISDGKDGKLFPLKDITLSDGTNLKLPLGFSTFGKNYEELFFVYTQEEYNYNSGKTSGSGVSGGNSGSSNNSSSSGSGSSGGSGGSSGGSSVITPTKPSITPNECYYDPTEGKENMHAKYYVPTEECKRIVKQTMITPEGEKLTNFDGERWWGGIVYSMYEYNGEIIYDGKRVDFPEIKGYKAGTYIINPNGYFTDWEQTANNKGEYIRYFYKVTREQYHGLGYREAAMQSWAIIRVEANGDWQLLESSKNIFTDKIEIQCGNNSGNLNNTNGKVYCTYGTNDRPITVEYNEYYSDATEYGIMF